MKVCGNCNGYRKGISPHQDVYFYHEITIYYLLSVIGLTGINVNNLASDNHS